MKFLFHEFSRSGVSPLETMGDIHAIGMLVRILGDSFCSQVKAAEESLTSGCLSPWKPMVNLAIFREIRNIGSLKFLTDMT